LEAVAQSATELEYQNNHVQLCQSNDYQSDGVAQTWFEQKWLPHHEAGYFSCAVAISPSFLSTCSQNVNFLYAMF